MKRVQWRPQARQDAAESAAWYATHRGMMVELAFIDALQDAEARLSQFPASGSVRHANLLPNSVEPLRFTPLPAIARYLIYYLDLPTHVEVVRVWNAARGLDALMEAAE